MNDLGTQKGIKGNILTLGISLWWLPNGSQAQANKNTIIQNQDKLKKYGPIPTGIYTYVPRSNTILLVGIYEDVNKGISIVLNYFAIFYSC